MHDVIKSAILLCNKAHAGLLSATGSDSKWFCQRATAALWQRKTVEQDGKDG